MKSGLSILILVGLLTAGCGGSDKKPTAPSTDLTAVTKVLVESMRTAFLASLISDTTSVSGTQGLVQIEGENWTFKNYSPDGKLTLDGQLLVQKSKYPNIPAMGQLTLSGSQVGVVKVDMLVKVDGLQIVSTGTLELNGQVYDVAQLIAAGSSSG